MNNAFRMLIAAAALSLLPQVASAGFLNVPKQSLDLPSSSRIGAKGYAMAPAGFYMLCASVPSACKITRARNVPADAGGLRLSLDTLSVIDRVNREVNAAMRPQPESAGKDLWKIGGSSGDCEDYALTKRAALLRKGFPSSSLLMAAVVTGRGEDHAILVVRTDRGDFVLDNLNNTVKPWTRTGYTFLSMQDQKNPRLWNKL